LNKIKKFICELERASESSGLFRTVAAQIEAEFALERLDQEEAATAEDNGNEHESFEDLSEYENDDNSAYEMREMRDVYY